MVTVTIYLVLVSQQAFYKRGGSKEPAVGLFGITCIIDRCFQTQQMANTPNEYPNKYHKDCSLSMYREPTHPCAPIGKMMPLFLLNR